MQRNDVLHHREGKTRDATSSGLCCCWIKYFKDPKREERYYNCRTVRGGGQRSRWERATPGSLASMFAGTVRYLLKGQKGEKVFLTVAFCSIRKKIYF
jgi:hypothetical protein